MTRKEIIEFFGSLEFIKDNKPNSIGYKLSNKSCEDISDYIEANRKQDHAYISELRREIKKLKEDGNGDLK
jgi:hypothetical protein